MHPADIKAAINKAGSSQADVARTLQGRNVTPSAVWAVINGNSRSASIAKHISRITGLAVHVMWPGAYPELLPRTRQRRRG
jgi:lambda repressor-like predicted transcriptional regulator